MVNETEKLKELLTGFTKMEKEFHKFSSNLSGGLSDNFSSIIKDALVEAEKKTKLNRKPATLRLMKNGEINIVFDDPADGAKFYKGEK